MAHPVSIEISQTLIGAILKDYPGTASQRPERLSEDKVGRISELLARAGKVKWSRIPRIYAVLHMIDKVDIIQSFIDRGISDLWFPFTPRTLPNDLLNASDRYDFREVQDLVLTKGLDLERENGKHRHFARVEDVPLRKLGELGKGGFGRVDLVYSTITHIEYARKLIPRGKTFEMNAQKLKDFEKELNSLKKLHHKHIVQFVGSYTDPKFVCILMSPVADVNLLVFLTSRPLTRNQRSLLRTFYGCLATAVQYLHDNKVRHKDIKPQNILVRRDQVFLTDFGISHDWSDSGQNTTTGNSIKTERYCAPEVAQDRARNNSADMWSLGCVFLEIWTVLKGETLQHLDTFMKDTGSKTLSYHLNWHALTMWCQELVAKTETADEDPALDWIEGTIKVDPGLRWSAPKLVACIADADDDPRYHFSFLGQCCLVNYDSTASDLSSKRSSRAFDETGVSSVNAYEPAWDALQQERPQTHSRYQLPGTGSRIGTDLPYGESSEVDVTELPPNHGSSTSEQTGLRSSLRRFRSQQTEQSSSSVPIKSKETSSSTRASLEKSASGPVLPQPTQRGVFKIPSIRLSFIAATDQAEFEKLFKSAAGTNQVLDGSQLRDLLLRSKLPNSVLLQIWRLSSITKSGQILFPEFALAMYLCNLKLSGKQLPTVLPDMIRDEVCKMVAIMSSSASVDEISVPTQQPKPVTSRATHRQNTGSATADTIDDTTRKNSRVPNVTSFKPAQKVKQANFAGGLANETTLRKPIRSINSSATDSSRSQQELPITHDEDIRFAEGLGNVKPASESIGHGNHTGGPQTQTTAYPIEQMAEKASSPTSHLKNAAKSGKFSDNIPQTLGDSFGLQFPRPGPDLHESVRTEQLLPDDKAIFQVESRSATSKAITTTDWERYLSLCGHPDSVHSVAFSPDGRLLASGSYDKTIRLWDVTTGQIYRTLSGHSHWVRSVAFSPDGELLASGSKDVTIRLWDVTTGQLRRTLSGAPGTIWSVVFSPDSKLLASSSYRKTVQLWDVITGQKHLTLSGHSDLIFSIAFSPDGKLLASGSRDTTIQLWNTTTGKACRTLLGHSGTIWSVAFSPDGKLLASSSNDDIIRLWDVTTGQTKLKLSGGSEWIFSIAFSPDGKLLASGSRDTTIRLWDVTTGQIHHTLLGHLDRVHSVTFSPHGNLLASGSGDKTVRLWGSALVKENAGVEKSGIRKIIKKILS